MASHRKSKYVPSQYAGPLTGLSKVDLIEIAWDLALQIVGEDADLRTVYGKLIETRRTMVGNRFQRVDRLLTATLMAQMQKPET